VLGEQAVAAFALGAFVAVQQMPFAFIFQPVVEYGDGHALQAAVAGQFADLLQLRELALDFFSHAGLSAGQHFHNFPSV
jgi:hypothetical protein